MNQEESLCRLYLNDITCFNSGIQEQFNSSGNTEVYCSFIFPPGYSIYVEEFILDDSGPDNFVLLDEEFMEYKAKLKWEDRQRNLWLKLDKNWIRVKKARYVAAIYAE